MELVKKRVQTDIVLAKCECGGMFKYQGISIATNPPFYPHKCTDCGKVEDFNVVYPTVEYVEVEDKESDGQISFEDILLRKDDK